MNKFKIFSVAFSMLALIGLNSCDDDEVDGLGEAIVGPGTVYTRISANSNLSSLDAALNTATGDLVNTLDGTGPFTVLAPTNEAFTNLATSLGFESATDLLAAADPALLSQILTYHVIPARVSSGQFTDASTQPTVLGDNLTIFVTADGTVQIQDATKVPQTNPVAIVGTADVEADNGIVHYINKVLLPQAAIDAFELDLTPSLLDYATGTDDLSILGAALAKAGLTDAIAALDTARVLAPNNDAFLDLLNTLGDDYNSLDDFDNDVEIALLTDILLFHVLPPANESTDLTVGPATTLLAENTVEVIADNGSFVFGDATGTNGTILTANIPASNGVADIIDKVLLPQAALDFLALLGSADLATTVIDAPQLSILEEALIATDLVGAFVDATNMADPDATNFTYFRPATVFAPSNDAFSDLFNALGADYNSIADFDTEDEIALLTDILLYHVINGKVTSDNLEAGMVTTLAERDIEIISVLGTDDFVIGDATNNINANIITPDVLSRNGVAHIIDKVLLPQSAITFINSME
ncbi:MAG: fasciclin domain-containing protein [Maribacter sp.]